MENKPVSLLVVSLGKTLNGMPLSSCGRQVVGPSSLTKDMQAEHEFIRIKKKHVIPLSRSAKKQVRPAFWMLYLF